MNRLKNFPGVGPKSAQRLAFYLLHVPQEELDRFAKHLTELKTQTILCSICKNVAEEDPCRICADSERDQSMICVVEQPMDVLSIERTGSIRGSITYCMARLIPSIISARMKYILRICSNDLRFRNHDSRNLDQEIILATNPNMEGEATAMYVTKQLKVQNAKLKITRLAYGLPMGADIEYADEITLTRALEGRREY